jgi:hypothetical protein
VCNNGSPGVVSFFSWGSAVFYFVVFTSSSDIHPSIHPTFSEDRRHKVYVPSPVNQPSAANKVSGSNAAVVAAAEAVYLVMA